VSLRWALLLPSSSALAGGKPGLKVSWQVTAARHDAYAEAYGSPVEVEKPADERGHYLHPELFPVSAAESAEERPPVEGSR